MDRLQAQGDTAALREILLVLVQSATPVEHLPRTRPVWARLHVTWTPDVQTLLDAGLLRLDPPAPQPYIPTSAELLEIRQQRARAKTRAARQAAREAERLLKLNVSSCRKMLHRSETLAHDA